MGVTHEADYRYPAVLKFHRLAKLEVGDVAHADGLLPFPMDYSIVDHRLFKPPPSRVAVIESVAQMGR